MKKFGAVLACALLSFVLIGCGGQQGESESADDESFTEEVGESIEESGEDMGSETIEEAGEEIEHSGDE